MHWIGFFNIDKINDKSIISVSCSIKAHKIFCCQRTSSVAKDHVLWEKVLHCCNRPCCATRSLPKGKRASGRKILDWLKCLSFAREVKLRHDFFHLHLCTEQNKNKTSNVVSHITYKSPLTYCTRVHMLKSVRPTDSPTDCLCPPVRPSVQWTDRPSDRPFISLVS